MTSTMQYILAWIILKSVFAGHVYGQPSCRSVLSIANYILIGHVISRITGKSFDTCVISCENTANCLSINYMHTKRLCQLNSRSRATNPCDLKPSDSDAVYMDSLRNYNKDACAFSPCRNGGKCVMTSSCQGYMCQCGAYHKGRTCEDCTSLGVPLGMKNKHIPDRTITASSYEPAYPPHSGRLNAKGWVALLNDIHNPYFQVELAKEKYISRVDLKGTNATIGGHTVEAWIRELFFSYSLDGHSWKDYINSKGRKMFRGTTAVEKITIFTFETPIQATYFRVIPSLWEKRPALRIELYGCEVYN